MTRIPKFSVRIKLDDFIENVGVEKLMVDKLLDNVDNIRINNMKIVFYNKNISQKNIKEFINRHGRLFLKYTVEFTKEFKKTWFLINTCGDDMSEWRYMTTDNIFSGITSYIKLMKHIERKRK
jgi:hypothetical protein